ncbi:LOW QUALITY PROTEIN: hypothetical protein U9M48_009782 [Paspalum notatum var. saurae]|uniref:Uncharacterized protein n=1 Tax=Paspalum notatum var. saurae TaxID=547442 RepID=A0AAQ3STA8_PASNO
MSPDGDDGDPGLPRCAVDAFTYRMRMPSSTPHSALGSRSRSRRTSATNAAARRTGRLKVVWWKKLLARTRGSQGHAVSSASSAPVTHPPDACIRCWGPTTGYPVKAPPLRRISPYPATDSAAWVSRDVAHLPLPLPARSKRSSASRFAWMASVGVARKPMKSRTPSPGADSGRRSSMRYTARPCPGNHAMSANSCWYPNFVTCSSRSPSSRSLNVTERLNRGCSASVTCMHHTRSNAIVRTQESGTQDRLQKKKCRRVADIPYLRDDSEDAERDLSGVHLRIAGGEHAHLGVAFLLGRRRDDAHPDDVLVHGAALAPERAPVRAGAEHAPHREPPPVGRVGQREPDLGRLRHEVPQRDAALHRHRPRGGVNGHDAVEAAGADDEALASAGPGARQRRDAVRRVATRTLVPAAAAPATARTSSASDAGYAAAAARHVERSGNTP